MALDLDRLLNTYSNNPAIPVSGLPELSEEMYRSLEFNFLALQAACEVVLTEIKTFDNLMDNRHDFNRIYGILKLIAVSGINLLDSPSPSLPQLNLNAPFKIDTDGTTFIVF